MSAVQQVSGIDDRNRILTALLNDGNTVADYRADAGVTGTLTASAWANQIGAAGSLAQGTAGNQPIVLPFSGEKYAYLPGVSGNYLTTPNSVAVGITGDIAIVVKVAVNNFGAYQALISRDKSLNRAWAFGLEQTSGKLYFLRSKTGTDGDVATSSVGTGPANGSARWFAVTCKAATGKVNFYTSDDGTTWSSLGTEQTITTSAIYDNGAGLEIGTIFNGTTIPVTGKVYRAQIYNGIPPMLGGSASSSPVVDFDPTRSVETATNGATFTAATGEVWTLNNTGSKPAAVIGSNIIAFDGSAHKMAASFTLNQPVYMYAVAMQPTWASGKYVMDGASANTLGITKTTGTPKISLNSGSAACENAEMTLSTFHVLRAAANGASSSLQIDAGTATTGNSGAGNPGGLTLGADGAGANYGAVWYKRVILRTSAANSAQIAAYLKTIYGTP